MATIEGQVIAKIRDKLDILVNDELDKACEYDPEVLPNWMHVVAQFMRYLREARDDVEKL